jgi:hypothetical protein
VAVSKQEILDWLEDLRLTFDDGYVVWTLFDQIQLVKLREDVHAEARLTASCKTLE